MHKHLILDIHVISQLYTSIKFSEKISLSYTRYMTNHQKMRTGMGYQMDSPSRRGDMILSGTVALWHYFKGLNSTSKSSLAKLAPKLEKADIRKSTPNYS